MDKLSLLLGRYAFNARVFFNGSFCDANGFEANGVSGHLHLVRRGPVEFSHADGSVIRADVPSVVFYPRGSSHRLRVPEGHNASLLCADIVFGEGVMNPLARVMPDCVQLPLAEVAGLGATVELLLGEAASSAPGSDLVIDRLCEVLLVQVLRHEFGSGRLSPELLDGLLDRRLADALAAIHERPQHPWTPEGAGGRSVHVARRVHRTLQRHRGRVARPVSDALAHGARCPPAAPGDTGQAGQHSYRLRQPFHVHPGVFRCDGRFSARLVETDCLIARPCHGHISVDEGAVVRQGMHAAAGQRDAHAAGRRAGDPGKRADADGSIDQRRDSTQRHCRETLLFWLIGGMLSASVVMHNRYHEKELDTSAAAQHTGLVSSNSPQKGFGFCPPRAGIFFACRLSQ